MPSLIKFANHPIWLSSILIQNSLTILRKKHIYGHCLLKMSTNNDNHDTYYRHGTSEETNKLLVSSRVARKWMRFDIKVIEVESNSYSRLTCIIGYFFSSKLMNIPELVLSSVLIPWKYTRILLSLQLKKIKYK